MEVNIDGTLKTMRADIDKTLHQMRSDQNAMRTDIERINTDAANPINFLLPIASCALVIIGSNWVSSLVS